MNRFKNSLLLASVLALALSASMTGCSRKEVSNDTLEDARSQSLQNGVLVARAYIRENPRLRGMDVVGHSDEHQTLECPQGSGWAHLSAMRQPTDSAGNAFGDIQKTKLVCSTVSANIGCYREEDFANTAFKDSSTTCDRKLPFPLPKIVGKS